MWDAVAHTIGGLCASLVLVVSPERIVLSGGVMNRESLYPKVGAVRFASACCSRMNLTRRPLEVMAIRSVLEPAKRTLFRGVTCRLGKGRIALTREEADQALRESGHPVNKNTAFRMWTVLPRFDSSDRCPCSTSKKKILSSWVG